MNNQTNEPVAEHKFYCEKKRNKLRGCTCMERTITITESEYAKLKADAERLDFIQENFTGLSDSERYLPFQIYFGKGQNKTLREAIDQARNANDQHIHR
ncbi:MAG: hypothetical protein CTY37_07145 [Methylotenera sp.]|nr:MAG: hypothetical protein CTY37_07145 [Methylotenera sp.]PPD17737.1 MAG: hypothetical protein CTY27_03265 [Methylotenera sp.]